MFLQRCPHPLPKNISDIGGTSQEIKNRINFHKSCNRHAHLGKSCELAKKEHELTRNGKTCTIRWHIKEKSKSLGLETIHAAYVLAKCITYCLTKEVIY